MKTLIAGSVAILGFIAAPAQAQSLGTVINSVLGSGYSNPYPPYYGHQPTYSSGYQPSYGYAQPYRYLQRCRYTPAYNRSAYGSYDHVRYQRSYGYYQGRSYEQRRHERRHHRRGNDDDQD